MSRSSDEGQVKGLGYVSYELSLEVTEFGLCRNIFMLFHQTGSERKENTDTQREREIYTTYTSIQIRKYECLNDTTVTD